MVKQGHPSAIPTPSLIGFKSQSRKCNSARWRSAVPGVVARGLNPSDATESRRPSRRPARRVRLRHLQVPQHFSADSLPLFLRPLGLRRRRRLGRARRFIHGRGVGNDLVAVRHRHGVNLSVNLERRERRQPWKVDGNHGCRDVQPTGPVANESGLQPSLYFGGRRWPSNGEPAERPPRQQAVHRPPARRRHVAARRHPYQLPAGLAAGGAGEF